MNSLGDAVALLTPAPSLMIDGTAGLAARRPAYIPGQEHEEDFRVLIPIWGSAKYLTNLDAISPYGDRVTLCSAGDESRAFHDELAGIAREHGFRTWHDAPRTPGAPRTGSGRRTARCPGRARTTGGTTRDRLIRNALLAGVVTERYVIPLDADSVPSAPLSLLAGEMARRELDAASVRIIPGNARDSALARLQHLEYTVAMRARCLSPWMLPGACHIARTDAWRDVMSRHSLFFQGNDVEAGLIAEARGYRAGHTPFDIQTDVPASPYPWPRQRLARAGGQVRLFLVNFRTGRRHPFTWPYGAVITWAAITFRRDIAVTPDTRLLAVAAGYLALACYLYLHRGGSRRRAPAMPFYLIVNTFLLTPLGLIWYAKMALGARTWGIIRPQRKGLA
jgi:hypothetical protein